MTDHAELKELAERLGYHSEHPVTGKLVLTNPDGPKAADAILALLAEIERMRGALKECLETLCVASRILSDQHKVPLPRAPWGEQTIRLARAALGEK